MRLIIYPKLSTCSKRSFIRLRGRFGNPHLYHPRIDLIRRLQYELGWTELQVLSRIEEEREYLLQHLYGENYFQEYLNSLIH
ncbi:MAG TPA: hypothetical protein V6C65_04680 [Allocoleopsis sp.]